MTGKPPPLLTMEALTMCVDVSFALNRTMRRLQVERGGFTYDELAQQLQTEFNLSEQQAKDRTWHFVTQMNELIQLDGTLYRLSEPPPPTINETILQLAVMADLKPRKRRRSIGPNIPRRRGFPPPDSIFEQYRPRRDRLMADAPESIVACYDNHERGVGRYTVLFGGKMWTIDMARRNWEAGIDPRVTYCVGLSANPSAPNGVVSWGQCLPGSFLGRKIGWDNLPPQVRQYVTDSILKYP